MNSVLIDTNVLVYCEDRSEPDKQLQAVRVLDAIARAGHGCVSTQVACEYFNALTRRLRERVSPYEAADLTLDVTTAWPMLVVDAEIVREGLRGAVTYGFGIRNAQLWATALEYEIPIVLTEDFRDGAIIEGVRFVNPFAEGFSLELLA